MSPIITMKLVAWKELIDICKTEDVTIQKWIFLWHGQLAE